MPLYEYRCPGCGHREERLRKIEERDQPLPCGACSNGSEEVALVRTEIPSGVRVFAPEHFQQHIHTTGRPLTGEGQALVRQRSRWNRH